MHSFALNKTWDYWFLPACWGASRDEDDGDNEQFPTISWALLLRCGVEGACNILSLQESSFPMISCALLRRCGVGEFLYSSSENVTVKSGVDLFLPWNFNLNYWLARNGSGWGFNYFSLINFQSYYILGFHVFSEKVS